MLFIVALLLCVVVVLLLLLWIYVVRTAGVTEVNISRLLNKRWSSDIMVLCWITVTTVIVIT